LVVRLSDALYEPISRKKTYELVADSLLGLIGSRRLGPGDTIPSERELVQMYAVGRSSIREALRMLESKGVIRSETNGSFSVAQLDNLLHRSLDLLLTVEEADYAELFEVRRILEGEAAALAASRRSKRQVQRMTETVDEMEQGLSSQERFIIADLFFHMAIAEATKNRVIVQLMQAIRSLLQRQLASSYHIKGSPERAIEMHRLILEAIADRHPEEARQRMQEHVARVERDIRGAS
jgi:GntR family transcriptional repressor for pyruvate dehydrogenase complex